MSVPELEAAIDRDRQEGRLPIAVVATAGTTVTTSVDPLDEIATVCRRQELWLHVDAAYAGNAAICPEMRAPFAGWEAADSIVINPHKWLFTPFDCSVLLVRRPELLRQTFSVVPEYLRSDEQGVTNLMDLGIQLGRRFRALKLWFLLRAHGLEDLRQRIRNHIAWAREAAAAIASLDGFRLTTECHLSLFTFQYAPEGEDANVATERLLRAVNDDGRIYLSQTMHEEQFVIRFQVGQFDCRREDVLLAVDVLNELAIASASGEF